MATEQEGKQKYTIYALADPRDNTVKYVGLSTDVYKRFAQHILANDNKAKAEWIASLKLENLLPSLQILEDNITTVDEARSKERQWIKYLQATGACLTNHNDTCDSSACGLKKIRLELGVSQERLARRTKSISTGTIKRAENRQKVTYNTASQLLETINTLLIEAGRIPVSFKDLELSLY